MEFAWDVEQMESKNAATRLPKYMIPHQLEIRTALPKTSTGKVDKTQLRNSTHVQL